MEMKTEINYNVSISLTEEEITGLLKETEAIFVNSLTRHFSQDITHIMQLRNLLALSIENTKRG